MPEGGKQSPAIRNHSSLLSRYGVQRVPAAASPPFWLTVFPYRQPSPRGEGAPKGRIGHRRYERQRMQMEKRFCTSELFTKAPYPPLTRSPFPDGEGLGGATLRVDFYKGQCLKVVGIAIRGNAFPTYGGEPTPSRYARQSPSRGRGENVGRFECIYPSFLYPPSIPRKICRLPLILIDIGRFSDYI